MKVKIFYGTIKSVTEAFNRWAKGKALSRNIIIHSVAFPAPSKGLEDLFAIFVYYPEWIEEQPEGEKP